MALPIHTIRLWNQETFSSHTLIVLCTLPLLNKQKRHEIERHKLPMLRLLDTLKPCFEKKEKKRKTTQAAKHSLHQIRKRRSLCWGVVTVWPEACCKHTFGKPFSIFTIHYSVVNAPLCYGGMLWRYVMAPLCYGGMLWRIYNGWINGLMD